jgi:hypothetical protein
MNTQKLSISLSQQARLAACYREANQELTDDNDFDITASDGLEEDETW